MEELADYGCVSRNGCLGAQQRPGEVAENRDTRGMSTASARSTSTGRLLALVALAGVLLGISAQLLRQVDGPAMALGGATAPWLTVGFLLAMVGTRHSASTGEARGRAITTLAIYLVAWLAAYHATFSVRELIKVSEAWREAAPWFLLTGPVAVVLGVGAARSHRGGIVGDVCLALPMAWSMPEIITNLGPDQTYTNSGPNWAYAVIVALPIAVLALLTIAAVGRRDVRLLRVVLAWGLLALLGLGLLPIVRNLHSFMAMAPPMP